MKIRKLAVLLLLCSAVVLAGCMGAQQEDASPTVEERAPTEAEGGAMDDGAPMDESADGGDGDAVAMETSAEYSSQPGEDTGKRSTAQADRQLIRTGNLVLVVDDANGAETEIRSLTAERGGYVAGSQRDVHTRENDSWVSAEFRLRIPAEDFDEVFEQLQTYGEVDSASTDTEDVTEQLVDIQARLENLRAERDRLRDLFEEANRTEDVLAVQSELADVQQEIERLEARQRSLQDRVAMATISVRITEEEPERTPDPDPAWYEVGVVDAFGTSIGTLGTVIRATVIAVVYATPFAIVFLTPFALGAIVYRRRNG